VDGVALVNTVTDDPEDILTPTDEWNAIAFGHGHLGIDQYVLELLFAAQAERPQTIACAPRPDGEVGPRLAGIEVCVSRTGCYSLLRKGQELGCDAPFA